MRWVRAVGVARTEYRRDVFQPNNSTVRTTDRVGRTRAAIKPAGFPRFFRSVKLRGSKSTQTLEHCDRVMGDDGHRELWGVRGWRMHKYWTAVQFCGCTEMEDSCYCNVLQAMHGSVKLDVNFSG